MSQRERLDQAIKLERGKESDGNEKNTVTTVGRRSGASLLLPLLFPWGFSSSATSVVGQRVREVQWRKQRQQQRSPTAKAKERDWEILGFVFKLCGSAFKTNSFRREFFFLLIFREPMSRLYPSRIPNVSELCPCRIRIFFLKTAGTHVQPIPRSIPYSVPDYPYNTDTVGIFSCPCSQHYININPIPLTKIMVVNLVRCFSGLCFGLSCRFSSRSPSMRCLVKK